MSRSQRDLIPFRCWMRRRCDRRTLIRGGIFGFNKKDSYFGGNTSSIIDDSPSLLLEPRDLDFSLPQLKKTPPAFSELILSLPGTDSASHSTMPMIL